MLNPPPSLKALARRHGIELRRPSADGSSVAVADSSLRKMLAALHVDIDDRPAGPPARACSLPDFLAAHPAWGISLQLYELRSERNWGIGDFADLWQFCDIAARLGADFVGLSPLHAPFMADPQRCSPYEPSNRTYLNPIYIAVDAIDGFVPTAEWQARLRRLRDTPLVDYAAVALAKIEALRSLWQTGPGRADPAFLQFVADGAEGLHLHALFEAISARMARLGHGAGWKGWPPHYLTPASPQIRAFEARFRDDIGFHKWLQWLAHRQLLEARQRAERSGMRIGLYLDLAVGEALDGSATWSAPARYVSGASVGNPPEPFATEGQDWRLAALLPTAIAAGQPSPFHTLLAASMRYAGAVRIDHAAALSRLFLVPTDGTPADGAYVAYPTEDLLSVLGEASSKYRCMVIGEDLGNVPAGLRDELAGANVLSYRILSYERTSAGFTQPDAYPQLALACVSTHDHQTFNGWWRGADIEMRTEHGLVPAELTAQHVEERRVERRDLIQAFEAAGILDTPTDRRPTDSRQASDDRRSAEPDLALAAYRFVAQTPSLLVAVRLADLTDETAPTNIPGTSDSYPNWKPKLSVGLDGLADHAFVQQLSAMMRRLRPR